MNSDLGEYLREGIERAAAAERLHPDVAWRARQRNHRRALTVRAAAVTGTAAVAAAVFAATVGTGSPAGNGVPVQTTAFVVKHAVGALAAAGDGNLIEKFTWTPPSGEHPLVAFAEAPSRGKKRKGGFLLSTADITRLVSWNFQGQMRTQGFTSDGKLAADVGPSTSAQAGGVIAVDPIAGKWYAPLSWFSTAQSYAPTCATVGFNLLAGLGGASRDSTVISKALSCHLFQNAGHEQVDGTDTIKLAATPDLVRELKQNDRTATLDAALWVDAKTFLPVRIVLGPQDGSTDFAWFDPTKAHLANLQVPVPAGLTEVKEPADASVGWGQKQLPKNKQ